MSRSKHSLRAQPNVERLVARRFFSSKTKAAWFSFQPACRRGRGKRGKGGKRGRGEGGRWRKKGGDKVIKGAVRDG